MTKRIGIDFGGVIVQDRANRRTPNEDTDLHKTSNEQHAQADVFGAMRSIVDCFDGQVWIVSKAGPKMQTMTLNWLEQVNFYDRTLLPESNVRFCLEREEKADICRELDITDFIDDRIHVMQILRDVVPHLYLFGTIEKAQYCPPWARYVSSWNQITDLLDCPV